ncbi:Lectin-domain containing receptor kinase A4.3 [Hordeum vulgare]|nr:Lectin-domain containing receptor kinase A4.3 [Hordeum vulgare]
MDMDGFPLDHVFPDDYGLEYEDELDIDGEPLFKDELANQAVMVQPKRKSRWTKAYTADEDKLLCECWRDIGKDPKLGAEQKASTFWIFAHREFHERKKFLLYQMQSTRWSRSISKRWKAFLALEAFKVQHEGKSVHLSQCWRIIKNEEKFKAQYVALMARGAKEAVEEVGEGEQPRPRRKTNSKEDKRAAMPIALIAIVKGMMTKKDSREEKCQQDKEEQMNAFMEI